MSNVTTVRRMARRAQFSANAALVKERDLTKRVDNLDRLVERLNERVRQLEAVTPPVGL